MKFQDIFTKKYVFTKNFWQHWPGGAKYRISYTIASVWSKATINKAVWGGEGRGGRANNLVTWGSVYYVPN